MNDTTKPSFLCLSSLLVDGERYTFSLQELAVSSGPCTSRQEALDTVFKAIRDFALSLTPNISALAGPVQNSDDLPVTVVRDIGTGAGAAILRLLIGKYGHMTNRQLAQAIGLTGIHEVKLAVFSNSLAGKGSRFARCAIAMALGQLPSSLWPFLSEKTRQADDDLYLTTLSHGRKSSDMNLR